MNFSVFFSCLSKETWGVLQLILGLASKIGEELLWRERIPVHVWVGLKMFGKHGNPSVDRRFIHFTS